MRKFLAVTIAVLCFTALSASSNDDVTTLRARLSGLNEVDFAGGNPGPINTAASGSFSATVSADGTTVNYTLTFTDLSNTPLFSHIHFAPSKVSGGVMVFLCGPNAGSPGGPPAGFPNPPSCGSATTNTITGTITAANVIGSAKQGVPANDLATLLRLIREGDGYVNLHSANFPAGEIRGQIRTRHNDD